MRYMEEERENKSNNEADYVVKSEDAQLKSDHRYAAGVVTGLLSQSAYSGSMDVSAWEGFLAEGDLPPIL